MRTRDETGKTGAVSAKGAPRAKPRHIVKPSSARSATASKTEQLVFTLRGGTSEVVKIEKIDIAGKRSEVPDAKAIEITGKDYIAEIEAALDEAFEAGISSILNLQGGDEPTSGETSEEISFRRLVLELIIDHDARNRAKRRILQRFTLGKSQVH
jgi:hypothetical protein